MIGGKILSQVTSVTLLSLLTGCGYSSLYNPDKPDIKSFYENLDRNNSDRNNSDRNSSDRNSSDQNNSVRNSSVRNSSVRNNSVRNSSVRDSSVRDSSVRDSSVRDSSVRDSSVRDSSVRDCSLGLSKKKVKLKKKTPVYNQYYQKFINRYKNIKIAKVTHRVGDNQFEKKYKQGFLHKILLNPLTNSTVLSSERVWIASIADYNGWFLRSELNKLLHTVKPTGYYKYVLRVSLTDSTSSFSSDIYGVPNRFKYLLYASYSIEDFKTGKKVYTATSQAVTSYTLSRSLTGLTFAEKDAKEKALVYISTKIYTNIIAWLYHNEHQIEFIKPKVVEQMNPTQQKQSTKKGINLYPLPVDTITK